MIGGHAIMCKKEIVEKILEEYKKFGLSRIEVEISYLLAILWRVPKESIYPGMRMIFNNLYGTLIRETHYPNLWRIPHKDWG